MPASVPASPSARLTELCDVVRKGMQTFVEVGAALLEIRESGLYKERCATFEAFVQLEFGMSRAHAYRQIEAAQTVGLLSPMGDIPESERQVRPLNRLPKEDRPAAWKEAVKQAGKNGAKVTAETVRKVVDHLTGNGKKNGKPSKVAALRAMREANAAGIKDDDHDAIDLPAELRRLSQENDQLRGTIESLQTGNPEREIAKLQERLARMDGRLTAEIKAKEEAVKQAKYSSGLLQKIRAALKVQENKQILGAIAALK